MPGAFFNLIISKPESSATHILPVFFEKYFALINELALKLFPFSLGLLRLKSLGTKILVLFGNKSFISLSFPRLFDPITISKIFFLTSGNYNFSYHIGFNEQRRNQ